MAILLNLVQKVGYDEDTKNAFWNGLESVTMKVPSKKLTFPSNEMLLTYRQ